MKCLCVVILCAFSAFGDTSKNLSCLTPNGEQAICVELRSCPVLSQAYFSADETEQRFALESASACGNTNGTFLTCCGTSNNFIQVNSEANQTKNDAGVLAESKRDFALKNLIPARRYCGLQHWDDYFHDENNTQTSIDEFPWLVTVNYDDKVVKRSADFLPQDISSSQRSITKRSPASKDNSTSIWPPVSPIQLIAPARWDPPLPVVTNQCLGFLISNRYAVTAGNCGSKGNMWITLGQHAENKHISCIKTPYGDDCSEPVVTVNITEQMLSPNGHILLLRLERKINYSDYVRPICLPVEESDRPKVFDTVMTSGWGLTYENTDVKVNIKKRTEQRVGLDRECSQPLPVNHVCILQKDFDNYVCGVDRGGPIMYRYKNRNWFASGIVDDISDGCNYFTVPGKHITPDLVNWILDNVRS